MQDTTSRLQIFLELVEYGEPILEEVNKNIGFFDKVEFMSINAPHRNMSSKTFDSVTCEQIRKVPNTDLFMINRENNILQNRLKEPDSMSSRSEKTDSIQTIT